MVPLHYSITADGRIVILIVAVVAASGEHDPKADSHKKTAHTELALACRSKSGRWPVETTSANSRNTRLQQVPRPSMR